MSAKVRCGPPCLTGQAGAWHASLVPNSTELPNRMVSPNKSPANPTGRPALDRALAAFEAFEHRLISLHAPEFATLDITMAQAKLLYVVTAAGELTMSEIGHRLGVTVSTASGAVEHLVALGLLARLDDPANRRQVRVSVTPAGFEALEQLRELSRRQLAALFDLVPDGDLDVIERAIRILTDAVDRAAPAAPSSTEPSETSEPSPATGAAR